MESHRTSEQTFIHSHHTMIWTVLELSYKPSRASKCCPAAPTQSQTGAHYLLLDLPRLGIVKASLRITPRFSYKKIDATATTCTYQASEQSKVTKHYSSIQGKNCWPLRIKFSRSEVWKHGKGNNNAQVLDLPVGKPTAPSWRLGWIWDVVVIWPSLLALRGFHIRRLVCTNGNI